MRQVCPSIVTGGAREGNNEKYGYRDASASENGWRILKGRPAKDLTRLAGKFAHQFYGDIYKSIFQLFQQIFFSDQLADSRQLLSPPSVYLYILLSLSLSLSFSLSLTHTHTLFNLNSMNTLNLLFIDLIFLIILVKILNDDCFALPFLSGHISEQRPLKNSLYFPLKEVSSNYTNFSFNAFTQIRGDDRFKKNYQRGRLCL